VKREMSGSVKRACVGVRKSVEMKKIEMIDNITVEEGKQNK